MTAGLFSRRGSAQTSVSGDGAAWRSRAPVLRKLSKYEILEEIGHGGMATVYRARDVQLDRDVAVKVMHPHLRGTRDARVRLAREARSVARLKHPNILQIYDYSGEDSEESFIATELLTGPTLKQFTEAQPTIPAEIAACFTIEIARALGAAHAAGIIHRDIKPENVLIHENRCVKLTDFGIAHMADAQSFTVTGEILGSPGHMAPEQIDGGTCDERSDLFSLGTVLYYLATCQMPFSGRNPHQVLRRVAEAAFADPQRVQPSIGGTLRNIIVKALAKDPGERYASASEFEADLIRFIRASGLEDPAEELARYLANPKERSTKLRTLTIEHLTNVGEQAAAEGNVPLALEHFSRVLAMDETNPRVLALVDRIQRRASRRSVLFGIAGALSMLVLFAVGYVALGSEQSDSRQENMRRAIDQRLREAREGGRSTGSAIRGTGRGSNAARGSDAGAERNAERIDGTARGSKQRKSAGDRTTGGSVANPDGPRVVIFRPDPPNVSIGVDGAEPRPYGPSFRSVSVAPGSHRFRFVGGAECCEDDEVSVDVPPASTPFTLAHRLRFRPAGLYVISNTPANVIVDDGFVRGRTRDVLRVPMDEAIEEVRQITVTAPGHEDYTQSVRLRAGRVIELNVTLSARGGTAP